MPLQVPALKVTLSWCNSTAKVAHLKEHVVPIIEKWGIGCGMIGEQGTESIHKYFNVLEWTYCSIPDRLQRLKQKVFEHYLHTSSTLADVCPALAKIQSDYTYLFKSTDGLCTTYPLLLG